MGTPNRPGIGKCLADAVQGGFITEADREKLLKDYERYKRRFERQNLTPEEAEMKARQIMAQELQGAAEHRKRKALLQLATNNRNWETLKDYRSMRGLPIYGEGILNMLEHFGGVGYESLDSRHKAIVAQAHQKLDMAFHQEFAPGLLSGDYRRSQTSKLASPEVIRRAENMLKEAYGENSNDPVARKFWNQLYAVAEELRTRRNAAGGQTGKLENWFPVFHDAVALRKMGEAVWIREIIDKLDHSKMRDASSGMPMDRASVLEALPHVFQSITQDGWNTRDAAAMGVGIGSMANRRMDHRFLIFKDANAHLEYAKLFGKPDVFATMMSHVNGMAKEIAAMEMLGPNPKLGLRYLMSEAKKAGEAYQSERVAAGDYKSGQKVARRNDKALAKVETLFDYYTGAANQAVNQTLATGVATFRNLESAAKLGSAMLSALGDPVIQAMTRYHAGIPTIALPLQHFTQLFSKAKKQQAVEAGLIMSSSLHVLGEHARYAGAMNGSAMSRNLASRTIAISGLEAWTEAGKHSFGLAFQAVGGKYLSRDFSALPARFKRTLEGYGIKDADWKLMQGATPQQVGRTKFLRPTDIAAIGTPQAKAAAEKYLGMILQETQRAVPEGTMRGRMAVLDRNRPGTISGELTRSAMQFKGFAVTLMMMHGQVIMREFAQGRVLSGMGYAFGLLLGTTLAGALSVQLKAIKDGKDPRPMNNLAFWGAALAQGGGLGIMGDFFSSSTNRFSGGLAETIAGPLVGTMSEVMKDVAANTADAIKGKKTHFGRDAAKTLTSHVPGQSMWMWSLPWQRYVADNVQRLFDPEAPKAFAEKQRKLRADYKTDFWWRPGDTSASRAPNLGNMLPR